LLAIPEHLTRAAGDALEVEQEEKKRLQLAAMSLQDRIANMAATREAGNKQLSGQIQKLRQQLDKSKRLQHESQAQVCSGLVL
jgi:hypothetical protein